MIFSPEDLQALWLTTKLAAISSTILLLISLPIAWWLARTQSHLKIFAIPALTMPLILPPTVLGFYLLLLFSPESLFASTWQNLFNSKIAFSFSGLVIASIIYSLPFMVQPLYLRFSDIPLSLLNTASSLGANALQRFFYVAIPMSRNALITGFSLAFAHTLGEFGVVLIIGGNIPGETRVLSIALYEHIETLQYNQAHLLAGTLFVMAFLLMIIAARYQSSWSKQL